MNKIEQAVIDLGGEWPEGSGNTLCRLPGGGYYTSTNANDICTYDQFMETRKRLENKPNWILCPKGYQWRWQNSNGTWKFGRGDRPRAMNDGGGYYVTSHHSEAGQGCVFGDWRNTLERRPESKSMQPSDGVDIWPQYEVTAYDGDDAVYRFRGVLGQEDAGPAEWDGEGLPPVGTICKVRQADDNDYAVCLIMMLDAPCAIYKLIDHGGYGGALAHDFRPLKSHRDKVIEALEGRITSFQGVSMRQSTSRELAEWLADIGLKLPEGEE